MKKSLIAILLALVVLAMALTGCSGETKLKMATGGTTGTYYAFGGVISQTLSSKIEGLSFDVQSTGASKANVYLVADGEVEMALAQNDVMDYAYNGTGTFDGEVVTDFYAMAALYAEHCQVVATKDITDISQLAGKRVSVGDAGSGTEFNTRQILEAYGISFDDIEVQYLSFGDSATAMKDGKIDAFFCTAGAPTTAVVELATTHEINVLNIDDEHFQTLVAAYPFYSHVTIPAGTYNGVDEVKTVAVKASYIVDKELDEQLVYDMTKALFENKEEITVGHAKGAELDPAYAVDGISVPFHPGAEKYFKEVGALS